GNAHQGADAGTRRSDQQPLRLDLLRHLDEHGVHGFASSVASSALSAASIFGSSLMRRITGWRQATALTSKTPLPGNSRDERRPTCSPSQPPSSAPGPAGIKISQRMVLVMRPSIGAGVTLWRSDRKLMKISTAPAPKQNSMKAKAATPKP